VKVLELNLALDPLSKQIEQAAFLAAWMRDERTGSLAFFLALRALSWAGGAGEIVEASRLSVM
jgi:hypothetical protein